MVAVVGFTFSIAAFSSSENRRESRISDARREAAAANSFSVGDKGSLEFALPPVWKEVERSMPALLPPTFSFRRSGPVRGTLQVTVFWSPSDDPAFASQENIRSMSLKGQAALIGGGAVEDQLPLHSLQGAQGQGFMYSAIDKSPAGGPDDFPVLTHGELGIGNMVASFTVLSDARDNVAVQEAVAAIRKSRFVPGGR